MELWSLCLKQGSTNQGGGYIRVGLSMEQAKPIGNYTYKNGLIQVSLKFNYTEKDLDALSPKLGDGAFLYQEIGLNFAAWTFLLLGNGPILGECAPKAFCESEMDFPRKWITVKLV